MNSIISLLGVLALAVYSSAQIISFGSCPSPSVIPTLDPQQYSGVWYENSKTFQPFEAGMDCISATYTANPDGSIGVYNQGRFNIPLLGPREVMANGTATPTTTPPNGQLVVSFDSNQMGALQWTRNEPYWILSTDYTSYAVVWSCMSRAMIINTQSVWILTREQNPAANSTAVTTARHVLTKNNINPRLLMSTNQNNC